MKRRDRRAAVFTNRALGLKGGEKKRKGVIPLWRTKRGKVFANKKRAGIQKFKCAEEGMDSKKKKRAKGSFGGTASVTNTQKKEVSLLVNLLGGGKPAVQHEEWLGPRGLHTTKEDTGGAIDLE